MTQRQWTKDLRERSPRVHCTTNYVTAGDVVNMMLIVGGSSVMVRGLHEVEDVTLTRSSPIFNLGTLEEKTTPAIEVVGRKAAALGFPVILDPVGVTASRFRRQTAIDVIRETVPSAIRGNEMETRALSQELREHEAGDICGVDSGAFSTIEGRLKTTCSLKDLTDAAVVVTEEEDMMAGKEGRFVVRNGHPWMARITSNGCMLDGLMGAFCGLYEELGSDGPLGEAVIIALSTHGLCGRLVAEETAGRGDGTGTFRTYLIDKMSLLNNETLERGKKIEI